MQVTDDPCDSSYFQCVVHLLSGAGNFDVPAFPPSTHRGVQSVGRRGRRHVGGILPNLVGPTLSLTDFLRWGEEDVCDFWATFTAHAQLMCASRETVHIPDTVAAVRQQTSAIFVPIPSSFCWSITETITYLPSSGHFAMHMDESLTTDRPVLNSHFPTDGRSGSKLVFSPFPQLQDKRARQKFICF